MPIWTRRRVTAALCAAAALHALGAFASPGKPATHTVTIDGTTYSPPTLTVNAGDRVVWVNKDPFPHTATAKGVFDSRSIAAGGKWTYTAQRRGEFDYLCTFHPTMRGRLVVK